MFYQVSLLAHHLKQGMHIDCIVAEGQGGRCWSLSSIKRSLSLPPKTCVMSWKKNVRHRRFYLDYTGPVSNQRGRTQVLWRGAALIHKAAAAHLLCKIVTPTFTLCLKTDGLAWITFDYRLPLWLKMVR